MSDEKYLLHQYHQDELDKILSDYMREYMKEDRAVLKNLLLPILYDQFDRPIYQKFTITGKSISIPVQTKERTK